MIPGLGLDGGCLVVFQQARGRIADLRELSVLALRSDIAALYDDEPLVATLDSELT